MAYDGVIRLVEGDQYILKFGYTPGTPNWFTYSVGYIDFTTSGADGGTHAPTGRVVGGMASIPFYTVDDDIQEGNETVVVVISGEYGAIGHSATGTYTHSYHVTLIDDDVYDCIFDVNQDGQIDGLDVTYSRGWTNGLVYSLSVDGAETQLAAIRQEVTTLLQQRDTASDAYISDVALYTAGVVTVGVSNTVERVLRLLTQGAKDLKDIHDKRETYESTTKDMVKDLFLMMYESADSAARALPLISVVFDTLEIREKSKKQIAEMQRIDSSLAELVEDYQALQARTEELKAKRNAYLECLDVLPNAGGVVFDSASSPSRAAGQQVTPVALADDFFLGVGGSGNDLIRAGKGSLFVAAGQGGSDTILAGLGSSYIDGGAGKDTVRIVDASGKLVRGDATRLEFFLPSGGFTMMTDTRLVALQNVERVEFADGYLELGKGKAIFKANYTAGRDTISGHSWDDDLRGGKGRDNIGGNGGNDTLRGDAGRDTLFGGDGDDRLIGGKDKDVLNGGAGHDIIDYSDKTAAVVVTLNHTGPITVRVGGKNEDTAYDVEGVIGGSGRDKLKGGALDNSLDGGLGKDKLWGKGGADTFVFSTKLGASNVDTIKDFNPAQGDRIALDRDIFSKIGKSLEANEFFAKKGATKGHDRDDRIIYDTKSGKLYYDADGNKKGGADAIHFATLSNKAALDAGDFLII